MSTRRFCSLSLDLDNQWSYMKTHGDEGWQEYPSYLDRVVPRALESLASRQLTITFFVVGQDAALDRNRDALASVPAAGHEVGNHSFNHEPWLHMYSRSDIDAEIARAEEAIERATGVAPRGFRGPGYSLSRDTLETLASRGYVYDASTFPTFLGPVARAYYFLTTKLDDQEKAKRRRLFGSIVDGFQPLRGYRWQLEERTLIEIPVSTMPILKIPFHFSYLLYLGVKSEALARMHFRLALWLCQLTGVEPSLLLHPLDFLGNDDVSELAFFPAMDLPSSRKMSLMSGFFDLLVARFAPAAMATHAERLLHDEWLPTRRPT